MLRQLSRDDYAKVMQPSAGRKSLGKPLAGLLSVLMGSTKQASFHCSASCVEHEKHGCDLSIHGIVRGDHVVSPLWSTSELTVYLHVHCLTSGLKRKGAQVMAVTEQEADERVGGVRGSDATLRFLSFTFRQAP